MVKVTIKQPKAGKGFTYLDTAQGSPEWVAKRYGKVTASRLADWLAESKPSKKDGSTYWLKRRTDYELELAYEKQFKVAYQRYVTPAMQAGLDYEDKFADAYSSHMGVPVEKCGTFYNDRFAASPDRLVGDDGLLEVKVLGDSSFSDVLINGVPAEYNLQIQGQLLATGRQWCDFVAGNLNTGRFKVIRVEADKELIGKIVDSLSDLDNIVTKFDTDNLYEATMSDDEIKNTTREEVLWT